MFGLACVAVLVASCTNEVGGGAVDNTAPDATVKGLDPTGNWNISYSFDAGCGQAASTAMSVFTVTLSPMGYAVSAAGATTSGTLDCTPETCKLSGMFAWSADGSQFQQNVNITLDAHDAITGNGTEAVATTTMTGTTTCSVTFTAKGMRT
jgi:hypothetical protein